MRAPTRGCLTAGVLLVLGLAAGVAVVAKQVPARDAGRTMSVGAGSISGTVVDAQSGAAIRRVTVVASDRSGGGSTRMSVTGDEGRFTLAGLPAGRYAVAASKATYLPGAYGLTKPIRPGTTPTGTAIALGDGQSVTGAVIHLARGSVVAGTVRGPDGRPARGVSVSLAYPLRAVLTGERTLAFVSGSGATTDNRGEYRMYGLPPGEYIASVRMSAMPGATYNDLEATTEADLRRITELVSARSGAGFVPSAAPADSGRRPTYGFAPVFYPGTTVLANAAPIVLGPGEERDGVDFQLQLVPQARVTGVVTGIDGRPAVGISLRLFTASPYAAGPFLTFLSATTDSQGAYTIRAVPAGDYVIEVRPGASRVASPENANGWVRSHVAVAPAVDLAVDLALQPGLTVRGRVSLDEGSAAAPVPDYPRLRLALVNQDGLTTAPAVVAPDGQFTIEGVVPDKYKLTALGAAPGVANPWLVKSVLLGGRDAFDAMTDIDQNVQDASIVLTNRVSELSGTILDARGQPAPEFTIIVFPADRALWTWQNRRIQQVRPSHDGRFVFGNLPAGEYLLGAVTDVEQYQWFEPSFLSELVGASVRLTLAEGEMKAQDIRLR